MKRIVLLVVWVGLLLGVPNVLAQTYSIQTEKSTLGWVGKKVVGGHDGIVVIKSGSFVKKGTHVTGTAVIDMTTIKNNDVENPVYRTKLENHLKSADFFDVAQFSESHFNVTSSKEIGKGEYQFKGDLTIKGITHEIVFSGTVNESDKGATLTSTFTIDRTKWNVVYNSKSFFDIKKLGDKMILDDIEFNLNIVLVKN